MPSTPTPPRDDATRHDSGERLHNTWIMQGDPEISLAERWRLVWDEALDIAEELGWVYISATAGTKKQSHVDRERDIRIGKAIAAELVEWSSDRESDYLTLGRTARQAMEAMPHA